jgi:hypothetical protein
MISSRDLCTVNSRSGLVVKFVLAMHEPRVRFTAATIVLSIFDEKFFGLACTEYKGWSNQQSVQFLFISDHW